MRRERRVVVLVSDTFVNESVGIASKPCLRVVSLHVGGDEDELILFALLDAHVGSIEVPEGWMRRGSSKLRALGI